MMHNSQKLLDALKRTRQGLKTREKIPGNKPPVARPIGAIDSLYLKATAGAKPAPRSILFVKSDSYGDLVLFAPALAWLRAYWPDTRVGLLLKKQHQDVVPLLPAGMAYLFTQADPHVEAAADSSHADDIARIVREFAPEILVAPSYEKTWVHALAAAAAPEARRIAVGPVRFDAAIEHYLQQQGLGQPAGLYPEWVEVVAASHELEKARALLSQICDTDIPPLVPTLEPPASALAEADRLLAEWKLTRKGFVLCNPAGTANVPIKAWPPHCFAEVLAWLHADHKLPVLLCAHRHEKPIVDEVVRLVGKSARLSVWLGASGQLPLMAALAARAKIYFGADTSTMHVAEAVGTPAVVVFGGGTWPRFRPVLPDSLALVHPLPCFGCGWHCHLDDALCIKLIQPSDVIAAWGRRLAKNASRTPLPGAVELSRLSPECLHSLRQGRKLYEKLQRESEERYAQILRLTVLARKNEQDIVFLNNATAALRSENEALKTSLGTTQPELAEHSTQLRAAEESRAELLRQNRELAAIAQQAQTAASAQQDQVAQLTALFKQSEAEALARSEQIDQLTKLALTREADATSRQQQIEPLTAMAKTAQDDSTVSRRQIDELHALLHTAEESRAELLRQNRELAAIAQQAQTAAGAQQDQVAQLTPLLKQSEAEALARSSQIDTLTELAQKHEADASARQQLIEKLTAQLGVLSEDSANRLRQIETLTAMVKTAQDDGAAQRGQVDELTALLRTGEESRAELLRQNQELTRIASQAQAAAGAQQDQVAQLTPLLKQSEAEALARSEQIDQLTKLALTREADATARQQQIEPLTAMAKTAQDDSTVSRRQIDELHALLHTAEESRAELLRQNQELTRIASQAQAAAGAQQDQVAQLTPLLKQSEAEALARSGQIDTLTELAQKHEADASARQQQIEKLTAQLGVLSEDSANRLRQIETLTAMVKTAQDDGAAQRRQVDELTALLRTAEESRAELLRQNQELTRIASQAQAAAGAQQEQVAQLTPLLKQSEAEALARSGQIDQLTKLALAREADAAARHQQIETLTAMVKVAQEEGATVHRQIDELTALLRNGEASCAELLRQNRELAADARRQTAMWRENLLGISREASLSAQLLAKSATQPAGPTNSYPAPSPMPCPGDPPAEEEIVFNVESAVASGNCTTVSGWAFLRAARDCKKTRIALAIVAGNAWFIVPAAVVERPDVVAAFPCEDGMERHRNYAGFQCRFDSRALAGLGIAAHLVLQAEDAPALYSQRFTLPS
jgi:ADP-heptose:LPS heptosyltransferase